MAENLRIIQFAENGTTELASVQLAASATPTSYVYYTRARASSAFTYKDIINNSPTVHSRQLVDFQLDAQSETIVIDLVATSLTHYQSGIATLNHLMQLVREGQRRRHKACPIGRSSWKIAR